MARNVEAGKAHVLLGVRNVTEKGLKDASKSFRKWGKQVSVAGAAISAAGGAALAPLLGAARNFAATGDQIQKMSVRTRIGAETLSQMAFAAEQSETSIESVSAAMIRSQRRIANFANTAGGPAAAALKNLGINAEELNQLDPATQFETLADVLNSVEDAAFRNQLAFEIFGDNWKDLEPLLREGSSGIRALRNEADALGRTISGPQAQAAADMTDAMNRVRSTVKGVTMQIGAALAPAIIDIANRMAGWGMTAVEFVRNNQGLIITIAKVATAVVGLGTAITAIGVTLMGAGAIFGTLATAMGFLLSPIGLVIGGLAALGVAAEHYFGFFSKAIEWVQERFGPLVTTVKNAVSAIMEAFATGDLEAVWDIALTFMETAWLDLTNSIMVYWDQAMNTVLDITTAITKAIGKTFETLGNWLAKAMEGYKSYYNSIYNWVTERIGEIGGVRTIGGPVNAFSADFGGAEDAINSVASTLQDFGKGMQDSAEARRTANRRDITARDAERKARLDANRKRLEDLADDAEKSKAEREKLRQLNFDLGEMQRGGMGIGMDGGGGIGARGTTSSFAAMFMGGSTSIPARQLKAQETTAKNTKTLVEEAQKPNMAAFA